MYIQEQSHFNLLKCHATHKTTTSKNLNYVSSHSKGPYKDVIQTTVVVLAAQYIDICNRDKYNYRHLVSQHTRDVHPMLI